LSFFDETDHYVPLKQTECPTVIFTEDDEKPFEEYTPADAPFSDPKVRFSSSLPFTSQY
jgi:hypothetical protein